MSTHNIGFYEDLTKIIFELSSNRTLFLLLVTCITCTQCPFGLRNSAGPAKSLKCLCLPSGFGN